MDSATIVAVVSIATAGITTGFGCMGPALGEGRSVASAMTSAAWRSHFGFRCCKSRRTAATARRVPKWTLASSRPIARNSFSPSWLRGNCANSIRLQ